MKLRTFIVGIVAVLVMSIIPSSAAASALFGKIVDQTNQPISGVKIVVTQMGKQMATSTTGTDGTYNFDLNPGAYSLQLIPPNSGFSSLIAYDILAPLVQPITFTLTPPTPGRAFITGHVTATNGFELSPNETSIGFGNSGSNLLDGTGFFKLMPTAGASGAFSISGKLRGDPFSFKMLGKNSMKINQDAIVEVRVPMFRQKIRVVTADGVPVAGASLYGGVGQNGLPGLSTMSAIEGLGEFQGNWLVQWMTTDVNGYVNLPALSMSAPSTARFNVSVPSIYKYNGQTFDATVGNGDLTFTLNKPIPMLSGTVKDLEGKVIDKATVVVTDGTVGGGTNTDAQGRYATSLVPNANYRVTVDYKDGTYLPNFVMKSWTDASNFSVLKDTTLNITLPINKTRVRVVDSKGAPLSNAFVSIKPKPSSFTDYTGAWSLFPGKKPLNTYFYSTGYTDAAGYVTLPTMKFDTEIDGQIYAEFGQRPTMIYATSIQKIGAGRDLVITLLSATVAVSGRITLSDGSPFQLPISFSSGTGESAQLVRTPDGKFTGFAPRAMVGQWWIGCGRVDLNLASDFCASLVDGPKVSASGDIFQEFVIPTYKTPVQVVNAEGKGIANVKVLINTQMKGNGQLTLIAGQPAFSGYFLSVGTTDSNGMAYLTSLKMNTAQKAYMELTPDSSSRYQGTGLTITVGDNSKNVVVLQIPKPVIYSVTVATVNGVRLATVNGNNLIGTISVRAGSFSFDDFTNKSGAITTQGFKVVNNNMITFPVPAGLKTAAVIVTNGGGTVTSSVITFNP